MNHENSKLRYYLNNYLKLNVINYPREVIPLLKCFAKNNNNEMSNKKYASNINNNLDNKMN